MSQASFFGRAAAAGAVDSLTGDTGGAVGPNGLGDINLQGGSNINVAGFPGANQLQINLNDAVTITGAFSSDSVTTNAVTVNTFGSGLVVSSATGVLSTIPLGISAATITTIGATTSAIITIALPLTSAAASFDAIISGLSSTSGEAVAYKIFGGAKTDGILSTLVGTLDKIVNEDAALVTADVSAICLANNLIINVTGVLGHTIDWSAFVQVNLAP